MSEVAEQKVKANIALIVISIHMGWLVVGGISPMFSLSSHSAVAAGDATHAQVIKNLLHFSVSQYLNKN